MSLLNNNRKTNLLFRQFVGTANALLPENSNFTNEPLKNINYVFNSEIQNQEVPLSLPSDLRISALDICNNIPSDSSFNLAAYGYPQLTFFKDIPLDPVPGAASQVWFKYIDPSANPLTNQSNNLLTGMIPFKFDDVNVLDPTYLPIVKRNFATPPSTNFVNVGAPNNTPLYWIQNSANGLIQFYATTTVLNSNNIQDITVSGVQDYTKAPTLSFYKYTGTYGAGGGSGGGGTSSDISDLDQKIYNLNRVVLPDGYVDISGTNYDLCGNEVVRDYYTYTRNNHFIGYDNLPILDNSLVDHTGDPSHNGMVYELDVSGSIYITNNIVSDCGNIFDISTIRFCDNIVSFTNDKNSASIEIGNRDSSTNDFSGNRVHLGRSNYNISIGYNSGTNDVCANVIAIGRNAGSGGQNDNAIAIGRNAGEITQSFNGIAIGREAGQTNQNSHAIAIGREAGTTNQGTNSIAIGRYAGQNSQGSNSIAIGELAGFNQSANSIILNAQANTQLNSNAEGLYIAPIRQELSGNQALIYDTNNSEVKTTRNLTMSSIIIEREVKVNDTNMVVKNDFPELYQPTGPPNATDYYEIAFINQSSNPPGTNNQVDCVTAYFIFTNNLGSGQGNDSKQIIHFIAGVYYDQNEPRSFIKVISNIFNESDTHVSELVIAEEPLTQRIFLIIGFNNLTLTPMENCEIRMYKNSKGTQEEIGGIYDGTGWIMGNRLLGRTTANLFDITNISIYPNPPYSINSLTSVLIIDTKPSPNAYTNLYENFLRDVDISANLLVNGNTGLNGTLTVEGVTTLNNRTIAQDISSSHIEVDISTNSYEGLTIINRGSGGPGIKFRHQSTSYLGNPKHHTIYVDDPGDNMHIDFGAGSGGHTLYLDGNTNSATTVVAQNLNTGDSVVKALVQNGLSMNLSATNGGRGKLSVNNGFTSGSGVGGGIDIQCSGTPTPQHDWYIGGSTTGTVGGAIRLKGLTETGGTFSTFASGEVRINSLLGGGTYEDIDFAINTVDTQNAFFVDAALNLISFGVSAEIPNIIGPTSITGDITINGNLSVNGNTYIDEDLSVNAVTTLTDLSFSDYLNNIALLPSETTIPFRKHQTVTGSPYRDLKVDGYSEYSITTENLSTTNTQEDWVTIARVGFQDMTNQSQRADGLFEITCNNSGTHQTIRLEASHHYKNGQTLDVVKNVTYGLSSNRHIKATRMSYGSIYDGGILQIQISQNTPSTTYTLSKITIKLYYNNNYFGWTSDLSGVSAPLPDNTPSGYSQSGYPGTGNILWNGSTYSNFTLFYPSIQGIDLTDRILSAGNPGQSVLNYTSDMILNKVYMKDDLDLSGNGITNIGSITTNHLRVESSGGTLLFEVEHSNNTAKLGLPLELERDSISDLSSIPQYSMVLANNIGSSWSTNTAYHRDCLVWRPRITSATPSVRILENEHIVQIYNRQISGASSSGGFGGGTQDNNYIKHTGSSVIKTAYFGVMPNGANSNASSSLPVNSKMHFNRECWITGIYLNTPFLDSPTFTSSSGSQGLFGFGANDYVDLEVGAPSGSHGYQRLYRIGNPSSGDYDSYHFPSSTWDATTGGINISLAAEDWIYIPAGTNMSRCVRFKAYINTNIWVRNDYSGTSFNRGHVEGYLVYVTSPKMIV